ncbi:MAG TPA: Fic family protein [Polyangiaceae bacterium]|nr:Fic family protein [Polyangiaceae bacterium]
MDGTEPGPFELGPFFPDARAGEALLERAAALVAEGHRLEAVNGPLAAALRPLLVSMNACHASELDGRPLRPMDIESPGASGASLDTGPGAALALARAHAAAELALSAALPQRSVGLYAPEFVQCIHAELHRRPTSSEPRASADPSDDLANVSEDPKPASPAPSPRRKTSRAPSPSAAAFADAPGAWRRSPVDAARGARPDEISDLLDHWQGIYSKPFAPAPAIVAALCAGQRLLGVRPFERGNGRSARLHTHLALAALGVTQGLWSPLRAMAKDRAGYRQLLRRAIAAVPPRQREDARREALGAYATWLLDACLAESRAARERLDPKRLERRLLDLLAWLGARSWVIGSERSVIKPDALEALHYAAITGPVERARFIAMLGLQHRTGRRVLSSLIDCGLLVSDSSRAPVRFNLPWPSLRFLFPDVWSEAAASDDANTANPWPADARSAASGAHAISLEAHSEPESRSAAG